jgi:hypothetical protein
VSVTNIGTLGTCAIPEPTSQGAKPRVQPGVHSPFYITNVGGEPRIKPGVWRPEMWAQTSFITETTVTDIPHIHPPKWSYSVLATILKVSLVIVNTTVLIG